MRMFVLGAALAAAVALPATAASAQRYGGYGGYGNGYGYGHRGSEVRDELRECRRELRRADSRWEYRRELRECRRELAEARRDDRYHRGYRDDYRYRGTATASARWSLGAAFDRASPAPVRPASRSVGGAEAAVHVERHRAVAVGDLPCALHRRRRGRSASTCDAAAAPRPCSGRGCGSSHVAGPRHESRICSTGRPQPQAAARWSRPSSATAARARRRRCRRPVAIARAGILARRYRPRPPKRPYPGSASRIRGALGGPAGGGLALGRPSSRASLQALTCTSPLGAM